MSCTSTGVAGSGLRAVRELNTLQSSLESSPQWHLAPSVGSWYRPHNAFPRYRKPSGVEASSTREAAPTSAAVGAAVATATAAPTAAAAMVAEAAALPAVTGSAVSAAVGASAADAGPPMEDALHQHHSIPPWMWCVSLDGFKDFLRTVKEAHDDGQIPNAPHYRTGEVNPHHDDPEIGPNMHSVNKSVIIPLTRRRGGKSWALMMEPRGLAISFFVTHSWNEGVYEFARKVLHSWPAGWYMWCCFLANPQAWDRADLQTLLGQAPDLSDSPFMRALTAGSVQKFLIVPNSSESLYCRLWCVAELVVAMEIELKSGQPFIEVAKDPLPTQDAGETRTRGLRTRRPDNIQALLANATCTDKFDEERIKTFIAGRESEVEAMILALAEGRRSAEQRKRDEEQAEELGSLEELQLQAEEWRRRGEKAQLQAEQLRGRREEAQLQAKELGCHEEVAFCESGRIFCGGEVLLDEDMDAFFEAEHLERIQDLHAFFEAEHLERRQADLEAKLRWFSFFWEVKRIPFWELGTYLDKHKMEMRGHMTEFEVAKLLDDYIEVRRAVCLQRQALMQRIEKTKHSEELKLAAVEYTKDWEERQLAEVEDMKGYFEAQRIVRESSPAVDFADALFAI